MIITPRNMLYVPLFHLSYCFIHYWNMANAMSSLAAVNFFLGCVGVVQVSRIFLYRRSLEGSSTEAAKSMEHEVADSAKAVAHEAEGAVKKS